MPLFRCSCILGGRCNKIKEDDDIPERKSNNKNRHSNQSAEINNLNKEDALLSLHRPSIGSLSLRMMVHKPGILIHRDLILTSHGNLPDLDAALDAEFVLCYLQCNSHRRRRVTPKTILTRRLEAHRFFLTDAALDLTLVACEPVENIPEIIPLSIHHHLGSMDLLEEGHQVYVIGHVQSDEMRGILASGSGCTSTISGGGIVNARNNTLVAFQNEQRKDIGLWMPGSAGFDEHGEFAFMVIDPYDSKQPEASFKRQSLEASIIKRKSLEAFSNVDVAQLGVPLYVIQDWMLMHGIRDLDNLPDQRELIYPMLDKSASSSTSIVDNGALIPHSNFPLSDRNSISYMVLNAGLVLESRPRRNSSPMGSFNSFESSSIDKEILSDKSSRELNSLLTCVNKEEETLIKEINELPTASNTLKQDVYDTYELIHLKRPSLSKGNDEHESSRIVSALPQYSISEKVRSYPLKWHSRTLPSSYKTSAENGEGVNGEDSQSLEIHSNDQIKELNYELIQNLSSTAQSSWEPQATYISQEIEGVIDHGKPAKISVSSDHIYEEISLATPKSAGHVEAIDQCDREIDEQLKDNMAGEQSMPNEIHKKQRNTINAEMQSWPIIDDSKASESNLFDLKERSRREERQEGQSDVGAILMHTREEQQEGQYDVGAIRYMPMGDTNIEREEQQEGQSNVGAMYMPRNDTNTQREEQQDCQSNVGAICMPRDDTNTQKEEQQEGQSHVGAMYMPRNHDSKQHSFSSSSSSSTTTFPSPLRPEEVSRRIQGYGNVSMLNMNASVRSIKESNLGNSSNNLSMGAGSSTSSPPLRNRFIDVGSSLVSGLWIKTSLNKAPHSDDYHTT